MWEYSVKQEIQQCLAGTSMDAYTVRPLDNVFVWVQVTDGNLRLAFSVQPAKEGTIVDPNDHINYVVGTGEWFSDAEITISRLVLSAIATADNAVATVAHACA